jgi:hypothetical protein
MPGAPALTRPAPQDTAGPGDQLVLAVHVPRRAHEIQPLFDGAHAAMKESYPLTEEALSVRRKTNSLRKIHSAFKKACCKFAKPPTPEEAFPRKWSTRPVAALCAWPALLHGLWQAIWNWLVN